MRYNVGKCQMGGLLEIRTYRIGVTRHFSDRLGRQNVGKRAKLLAERCRECRPGPPLPSRTGTARRSPLAIAYIIHSGWWRIISDTNS